MTWFGAQEEAELSEIVAELSQRLGAGFAEYWCSIACAVDIRDVQRDRRETNLLVFSQRAQIRAKAGH